MKTAFFSIHQFEEETILNANNSKHELSFFEEVLNEKNLQLAKGYRAVCIFVADKINEKISQDLKELGIEFIALRSAGFNHVDLTAIKKSSLKIARVPEYSPYSVAEHTVALMLALNRKLIHAHNRIQELNFSIDGLTGFDMHGKTAGIIGTGKIGSHLAKILTGFGCKVIAFDPKKNQLLENDFSVRYVELAELFKESDIISLHLPLTDSTKHLINKDSIQQMKKGVMIVNTSRGGLINTPEIIQFLKSGQIGYFGMDVYEEEDGLFFHDHSQDILQDDVIARLMAFQNVLITSHQAFLTDTALTNIAATTIRNLTCFEEGILSGNEL